MLQRVFIQYLRGYYNKPISSWVKKDSDECLLTVACMRRFA
jgi:hypothetical protein